MSVSKMSPAARGFYIGSIVIFVVLFLSVIAIASAEELSHSPVNGEMSSDFGWRKDPYTGKKRFHAGIDIAADAGTPIYVPQNGVVVFSGAYKGYGNVVVVQHSPNLYTLYGHTARSFVRYGQPVYKGQPIALVGSTGRSTGPHLHFEVRQNNGYVNPRDYLSYIEHSSHTQVAQYPYPGSRQNQSMGGPEVPVSYQAPVPQARYQGNTIAGNAVQAQHYRAHPGRSMQVISGSEVKVVKF